jgi:NAD(P)-dependent dehydrogenase (short-subunit alcohol dehydrogenase family)
MLEIFSVNVFGAIYCSREYFKYASTIRYGNILNISSNAALKGNQFETLYTSTKWALRGVTLSLAQEFAHLNIAVNEIEPGVPIRTPMSEIVYDENAKKQWIDPAALFPAFAYTGLQPEGNRKTGQHIIASERLGFDSKIL